MLDTQLAFILLPASEWDIALTVGLFLLGSTMSVIGWFFKKRMEAYDKHLDECRERAVTVGRMDERLATVDAETKWVGNCIIAIGIKLGADLPLRSQDRGR